MEIAKFESWGVLELMGHVTMAGFMTETTIAGANLLRIDVPARAGMAAFTQFIGPNAIYRLTPTGEAEARTVNERGAPRPIDIFLLPAGRFKTDDDDDDDRDNRRDNED